MNTLDRQDLMVRFDVPSEFVVLDLDERPDLLAANLRFMAVFLLDTADGRTTSGVFSVAAHQYSVDPQTFVDRSEPSLSRKVRVIDLPAGPAALVTEMVRESDEIVVQSHVLLANGPRTTQLTMATKDVGDWALFAAVFENLLKTVEFQEGSIR